MSGWALKEARESCETVFDRAWSGEPQFIMRDHQPMVVVISYAEYELLKPTVKPPKKNRLLEALRSCPCGDELAASVESLVTRNVKDKKGVDVELLNPFDLTEIRRLF